MFLDRKSRFQPQLSVENQVESSLNQRTREFFSSTCDISSLVKEKATKADLKLVSSKALELSFVITLVLLIGASQVAKQLQLSASNSKTVDIKIEVADIPVTQQFKKPPPPLRPTVPIPSEDEAIPEDVTIASTEFNLSEIPPPPGPPDEADDSIIFIAFDEPPEMIGGLASLQQYLKYPRLAHSAGLEGIVFVKVLVGLDGRTEKAEVVKAKPANMGFEESATEALMRVKWIPAKQRDKNIRVWVSIPVQFKLVS